MAKNAFALDLREYVEKVKEDIDKVTRIAILDLSTKIIMDSPVGKRELWADNIHRLSKGLPLQPKGYVGGRFRGSWDMALEAPPSTLYRTIDPSGAVSVDRVKAAIPEKAGGNMYFLTNNTPYAVPLEDGHSTQAPIGMVGINVMAWQNIVNDATK